MRILALILLTASLSFGMGSLNGYCEQGGQKVITNGASSVTQVQQSYPQCQVTVYYTGGPVGSVTTSGATVTWYAGTPFNANGQWTGLQITINSILYTVASVSSVTSLTLTSSPPTYTSPVAYSMGAATAPAPIFTANGSVLSNPFTATAQGYWQFYAANGQYDVKLSGGGFPSPVTRGSQNIIDPLTVSGTINAAQFGVKCDNGATDSTAAWQAAFNSMSHGVRLFVPCTVPSGVQAGVLYIPSTAAGGVVDTASSGVNATDTGQYGNIGGLIAISGTGPMVKVFADNINIRNFPLHCNSQATVGWQYSAIGESVIENSGADYCTGDSNQINAFGGSSTTLSSGIPSGSTVGYSFTVASATLTGQILGTPGCNQISVDYNTNHWELFEVHRSGNTLTIYVGTAAYTHNIGEDVRCEGNNDGALFMRPWGKYSGGWGFDIMEGSDNNSIQIIEPYMGVNALGGVLMAGSVNGIVGGHFEGNPGPAVQLGDLNGSSAIGTSLGRFNVATRITGILDMEGNGTNAVVAVCDYASYIDQLPPNGVYPRLVVNPSGTCPALPGGSSTYAHGPGVDFNGNPLLRIQTGNGTTQIGICGSVSLVVCQGGIISRDNAGNIVPIPGVFTGTSTSGYHTVLSPPNFIPSTSETGANNAIAFLLKDAYTGANIPLNIYSNGIQIPVALAHTLAAGAGNTVTINGATFNLSNPCNATANTLPHAWTAHSIVLLSFDNDTGTFVVDNGGC